MDSFEHVIASLLEREGFWTRTSVKVALTPEDKQRMQRRSSPRWELDVVGYLPAENHIMVLECKSYMDSKGVQTRTFLGEDPKGQNYYKLFFQDVTREVVLARLQAQLLESGSCGSSPRVSFGLAAGKILGDEAALVEYFCERGWHLWTPGIIQSKLRQLIDSKYENSIAAVVAKLLGREIRPATPRKTRSAHKAA